MNASKKQELERDTNAPPTKMKINPYIVIAIVAVAAAIIGAIVLLTFFFNKSQNEKRELQAQLEETEKQLEVKNDAIVALEDRQREQQTMIEKLEELINVKVPDPVITSANINEQLNSVQELATKEYIYTNASRREANKTWLWGWDMPFSDTNLLVTYDGTIKAGINLSKINSGFLE